MKMIHLVFFVMKYLALQTIMNFFWNHSQHSQPPLSYVSVAQKAQELLSWQVVLFVLSQIYPSCQNKQVSIIDNNMTHQYFPILLTPDLFSLKYKVIIGTCIYQKDPNYRKDHEIPERP